MEGRVGWQQEAGRSKDLRPDQQGSDVASKAASHQLVQSLAVDASMPDLLFVACTAVWGLVVFLWSALLLLYMQHEQQGNLGRGSEALLPTATWPGSYCEDMLTWCLWPAGALQR